MGRTPYPLPAEWHDALAGWLGHLKLQGLSVATRRLRRDHVRSIVRRSTAQGPRELTGVQLATLCADRDWSAEHRKALRASLTSFYDYCRRANLATEDPTEWLPKVRPSTPCPRPATDDIWTALLASAPPRERLMAMLACEAGLRRAEVAQTHRDDLIADRGGSSLVVHGKGGKQRVVPVTDRLAAEIRTHRSGGYLFPGKVDGHISVPYVGQLISKLMPPGWSMHKLRHRFATRGYAGTGNLRAVQEALGHASIATTQRYTAVTGSEVRAVSEAAGHRATA